VAQHYPWRFAYQIGGVLGFALLLLRIGVVESGMYHKAKADHGITRGSFLSLFTSRDRFRRFIFCILIGVPIWYTIGILVAYSPEFAREIGVVESISTARSVMFCYLGFVIGDFASGMLSQVLKSRNQAARIFIILNIICSFAYLYGIQEKTADSIYFLCVLLGCTGGYWAVVITMAAEQFGTNLRGTVATAVPNFIRFSVVGMSTLFLALKSTFGLVGSATIVGGLAAGIALWSLNHLKESFGVELDFIEKI
jgi:hypothetical protein